MKNISFALAALLTSAFLFPANAQVFTNATRLRGKNVCPTAPTNGQALVWNSTTGCWAPATPSGGSGASPAGSDGDVQVKAGAALAAAPMNCTGASCKIGSTAPTGLPSGSLAMEGASYMASGKVFVNASDTDPADYTAAKSGITVVNQAGDEVIRIWGTMPDASDAGGLPCGTYFNCMNLYIGWHAGFGQPANNTEAGYRNMGIGIQVLNAITSGFDNFGIGTQALYNLTEGSDNQAYGYQVLYSVTTGQRNTGNGNSALKEATGDSNTAMGAAAGQHVAAGSNNTFLGADADASGCGSCQNSAGIGANASVTVSNRMVFGDSNVTDVFLGSETALAKVHAGGGTATKLACWKSDGKTLGWATMTAGDISACN